MFGLDDVVGMGSALVSQVPSMLFNARQAAINRDFQENMANSQVQRRVADANIAGINPIFAVAGGAGAAAPGGAMASVGGSADVTGSMLDVANVHSAQAAARKLNAEADEAEVDAEFKKRTLRSAPPTPGIIESLPQPFQAPAAALASSAKGVADKIFGLLPDGSEDVEAMLKGFSEPRKSFVERLMRPKPPTSAVEAGRASGASVLPGGAVVGRAIPGQLNILRLKAGR